MHREAGRGRKRSPRVLLLINMSFLWDSGRRGYKNDVEGRSKKREESEREREGWRWGWRRKRKRVKRKKGIRQRYLSQLPVSFLTFFSSSAEKIKI